MPQAQVLAHLALIVGLEFDLDFLAISFAGRPVVGAGIAVEPNVAQDLLALGHWSVVDLALMAIDLRAVGVPRGVVAVDLAAVSFLDGLFPAFAAVCSRHGYLSKLYVYNERSSTVLFAVSWLVKFDGFMSS